MPLLSAPGVAFSSPSGPSPPQAPESPIRATSTITITILTPPFLAPGVAFSTFPTASPVGAAHADAIPVSIINPILRHGELVADRLKSELSVERLNVIHNRLWLAGRRGSIRPLHRQKLLQREIVITEDADLHLVWHKSRIFIKPLPLFLLDHAFFQKYLCSTAVPDNDDLHASACGLLRTYTSLIVHASDFQIAMTAGLLPPDLKWETWSQFAIDLRTRITDKDVNKLYHYGELRATRLDLIYYVALRESRGYHYAHTRYASLFRENFEWLFMMFLYTFGDADSDDVKSKQDECTTAGSVVLV